MKVNYGIGCVNLLKCWKWRKCFGFMAVVWAVYSPRKLWNLRKISKSSKLSTLFPPAYTIFTIFTIYTGISHLRDCVHIFAQFYSFHTLGSPRCPHYFHQHSPFSIFSQAKNYTVNFVQQHSLHLPLVSLPGKSQSIKIKSCHTVMRDMWFWHDFCEKIGG